MENSGNVSTNTAFTNSVIISITEITRLISDNMLFTLSMTAVL